MAACFGWRDCMERLTSEATGDRRSMKFGLTPHETFSTLSIPARPSQNCSAILVSMSRWRMTSYANVW